MVFFFLCLCSLVNVCVDAESILVFKEQSREATWARMGSTSARVRSVEANARMRLVDGTKADAAFG